jgi:hypothetical protein
VSGATYRIDVEHDPGVTSRFKWAAVITRLSDDYRLAVLWAESDDQALEKAQALLRAQAAKQPGRSLLVDDEGEAVTP